MNTIRIASIALLMTTTSASFASVDKDLKRCAADALKKADFAPKLLTVETPSNNVDAMDHNSSRFLKEYRMNAMNPKSGLTLGKITCEIETSA